MHPERWFVASCKARPSSDRLNAASSGRGGEMQTPHLARYVAWDRNAPFTRPREPFFVVVANGALRLHSRAGKSVSPDLVAHHQKRRHEAEASVRRGGCAAPRTAVGSGCQAIGGKCQDNPRGSAHKFFNERTVSTTRLLPHRPSTIRLPLLRQSTSRPLLLHPPKRVITATSMVGAKTGRAMTSGRISTSS